MSYVEYSWLFVWPDFYADIVWPNNVLATFVKELRGFFKKKSFRKNREFREIPFGAASNITAVSKKKKQMVLMANILSAE